jgi:hypothetical protein
MLAPLLDPQQCEQKAIVRLAYSFRAEMLVMVRQRFASFVVFLHVSRESL